jgi:hypothetical protein
MGVVRHSFKLSVPSVTKGLSFSFKRKVTTPSPTPAVGVNDADGMDSGSRSNSRIGHVRDGSTTFAGGVEGGSGSGKFVNMHIYDVGGAKGQRHTWASYFDGATAVSLTTPPFFPPSPFFRSITFCADN